ncbi:transmembrane protein 252 [Meriones unguiculatus]|uniref:transmembrane protein 252 n=1 Tax=Meriones unguiculatus TaxID=10047 RepID=UPI000B4F5CB2|nr:transmembrane protein 252 [Meriones unguiculatus]
MQSRAGLVVCALFLLTGFLMICLGGFFISNSIFHSQRNLVVAYVLLPMGFVVLLSGIFWGTYRQANENKEMFNHVLRRHLASQDLPLATIDRPDFYPPAYEESLDAEKQDCPTGRGLLGFPPPLYTETSLELEDENDLQPEAPPPYQESITVTAKAWDAVGPSTVLREGTALQHSELISSREERLTRDWEAALPPCTGPRPASVLGTHV